VLIEVALVAVAVLVAALVTLFVCRALPVVACSLPWLITCLTAIATLVFLLAMPYGSGTDELIYQAQALGVQRSWVLTGGPDDSQFAILDPGKTGWPIILGTLYYISGSDNPYLGVAVNAVVSYLALLLSVAAGARLNPGVQWREWYGLFIVANPALWLFGPSLLRESWAWLCVVLVVHGLLWLLQGARAAPGLLTMAAGAALAYWVRAPLAPILVAAALVGWFVAIVWRRFGTKTAVVSLMLAGAGGTMVLVPLLGVLGVSPEALVATRDYLADSASTGFATGSPLTPTGLAQALLHVGLGPLPWELRPSPVWVWVIVNWAFWLTLLALVVQGLRRRRLSQGTVALIVFSLVLLAGLAVGLTNYGIVTRMRATVALAVLPLAFAAMAPSRSTQSLEERA
jgi:hypothetical protein